MTDEPGPGEVDKAFHALSDDEVGQIGRLVEMLERSAFDFLQVEFGDLKLTVGKGGIPTFATAAAPTAPPAPPPSPAPSRSTVAPASPAPPAAPAAPGTAPVQPVAPGAAEPAAHNGIAVVAPLLGRFYAQPEPGAAPFIVVGSEVTEDTTVGLIEVMKTFNAVRAGVAGAVSEICVEDAQFVEYGQVLARVRPAHG